MKTLLIGALVFFLLLGAIFWYRDLYVKRAFRKSADHKYKIVSPLIHELTTHGKISEAETQTMASDPSLRHVLFRALEKCDRLDLFPLEYYTQESAAKSFLVEWLEFPTELGITPDTIELVEKVNLENVEGINYFVFRYRTAKPRWAFKLGWMIGVVGPYRKESLPFDVPLQVFSRFKTLANTSPQREALWVHDNINRSRSSKFFLTDHVSKS